MARDWWSALVSFASSFGSTLAAVLAAFARIINFLIQLLFLGQEAGNSSLLDWRVPFVLLLLAVLPFLRLSILAVSRVDVHAVVP